MRRLSLFLQFSVACAVMLATGRAALADTPEKNVECHLTRVTGLDLQPYEDGTFGVALEIDGRPLLFLLDMAAPSTVVTLSGIDGLHLSRAVADKAAVFDTSGHVVDNVAIANTVRIGDAVAKNVSFQVSSGLIKDGKHYAGILGANFLSRYDVELDFKSRKLYMYSQDHCPGIVVSWPNSGVAVVPVDVRPTGRVILSASLDGKSVRAILDTASGRSRLDAGVAQHEFDLSDTSSEAGQHQFRNLNVSGIQFRDVAMPFYDDVPQTRGLGVLGSRLSPKYGPEWDMSLGLHELQQLHVYVAYKEQKIYATAP
ncbi:MAG: retropepsin-like aspartic protease [Rhizomicrobium sp.]